jgi:tagaturonate reductase
MVPVAYLQGKRTVQETVESSDTGPYVRNLIFDEIIPTLDLPAKELEGFANDVLERFQNPFIRHELISISLNSISKYKVRVLPSVLEYYERKKSLPALLVHALAKLILFYKGEYNDQKIPLNDSPDVLEFFADVWGLQRPEEIVSKTLANTSFWGIDLNTIPGLTAQVTAVIKGAEKTSVVGR